VGANWRKREYNSFGLQPGQWTDDSSMGLCLADSLLCNRGFNPRDLRMRFLYWWNCGYNNAFGNDTTRGYKSSVGLGGNISQSFGEFQRGGTEYTTAGDRNTCGNGSVMRLAPAPVYFWADTSLAEKYSYAQSKTTHQGDEAAECCRIMAFIISRCMRYRGTNQSLATQKDASDPKAAVLASAYPLTAIQALTDMSANFKSDVYSIQCLAKSEQEKEHESNKKHELEDRNWNWKNAKFEYSPRRARMQPGYVGSYAMDALAMALHCVWTTTNFKDALCKCANTRGDCDSTCSVTGQLAGAIYGATAIPATWIQFVQQWDNGGDVALKAYKMVHHIPIPEPYGLSASASLPTCGPAPDPEPTGKVPIYSATNPRKDASGEDSSTKSSSKDDAKDTASTTAPAVAPTGSTTATAPAAASTSSASTDVAMST